MVTRTHTVLVARVPRSGADGVRYVRSYVIDADGHSVSIFQTTGRTYR